MATNQVTAGAPLYQCKSCEGFCEADGFYASNLSRCKECVKASVRENRVANADYYRAYDRKRYREQEHRKEAAKKCAASDVGKRIRAESQARSKREEPHKWKARNAVNNAIRDGKLAKGTHCYFCATTERLQAHHEDYNHPLDVVWLCSTCHGKLHTIKGDFRRAG
jgi:hypothetical protein